MTARRLLLRVPREAPGRSRRGAADSAVDEELDAHDPARRRGVPLDHAQDGRPSASDCEVTAGGAGCGAGAGAGVGFGFGFGAGGFGVGVGVGAVGLGCGLGGAGFGVGGAGFGRGFGFATTTATWRLATRPSVATATRATTWRPFRSRCVFQRRR